MVKRKRDTQKTVQFEEEVDEDASSAGEETDSEEHQGQTSTGFGGGVAGSDDEDDETAMELAALQQMQSIKAGGQKFKSEATNNIEAIDAKLDEIKLKPPGQKSVPWIETLALTNHKDTDIDPRDDLKREVKFYELALESVKEAQIRFDQMNFPHRRPADFYAEMVKSDEHMAKVKDRLIATKKKIEFAQDRKRQKLNKAYSKKVQKEKELDRAKKKKGDSEMVKEWRKGLKGEDLPTASTPGKSKKRKVKDEKYGFGGKKKRIKSNDAKSASNVKDFSLKKNKSLPRGFKSDRKPGSAPAAGVKSGGKRPGKNMRQKMRR